MPFSIVKCHSFRRVKMVGSARKFRPQSCLLAIISAYMGMYVYSQQQIEQIMVRNKILRLRFCLVAAALLVAALFLVSYRPAWIPGVHEWLLPVAIAVAATPLFNNVRHWRSAPQRWKQTLTGRRIEVSSAGVSLWSSSGPVSRFERDEILRAEEPAWGGGLYLRSRHRYRWLLIPKSIDNYESIKRELNGMGIPRMAKSIPPNWEEFIGVLLFVGTMLCAATVHNTRVLFANLLVSVLISVGGFLVIGKNSENAQIRKARLGVFLPVVFAALGLWLGISGWGGR
jgi:hypothetical protein